MFRSLPRVPDHPALELEILAWWDERQTFERLREANRNGPKWSFVDGPVTANKSLAVHTAWGRTLKDVFQRYKALRGFDQRFQNGFDCQGLWIEVGVERELGLNSKPEIEEYGLAEFARKCREKVAWSAAELTRGSKRLGMWMDWGNDYFTFSDTNIEYIWRFLQRMHEEGQLFLGHRSTEWCPRCGTSISAHELVGHYEDRTDPSLFVRFPLVDRPGQALAVWTTTPWTLPANVAAAVKPDAEYGLREDGEWVAVARDPEAHFVERVRGADLVGLRYDGPFDHLPAARGVEHRVIPWEDVSLEEGTGIVHIAPGSGAEDFELSRVHDLPVLTPVDEAGRFYPDYGWLHGQSTGEAAEQIVVDLAERGRLLSAGEIVHRFPFCWRCHTPLIFRIADDWFIAVEQLRPKLIEANATVKWTPAYFGKRMEDWLRNMGDWNISRRRYYGLPLPIYVCACSHVNVVGSKAELLERATAEVADDALPELRRPWIDDVLIRCEACGEATARIPEVGDVWLDAGIVPFSTLGWQNPEWVEDGYATGASAGLSGADLPDDAYWETWFPADWVSEMREQIRLWFYSQLFMSVALIGRAPFREVLGYEKMLDEHGREMHGSWGNMIDADDAFARMGADVMRWQFCAQPPDRNLLFGYGPADAIKKELLRLWNSVRFLVDYANIEDFSPDYADLGTAPASDARPLDRWLAARTQHYVAEATAALEDQLTHRLIEAFQAFVDDVSNWYIRRSRRRFWDGDEAAFRILWHALVQGIRGIAPVMPFLAEHLWRILVAEPCEDAPESVFLAGWPEAGEADEALLAEIAEVRAVVELGHRARGAVEIKLRQPLRALVVEGAPRAAGHAEEIAEELRVKSVSFEPIAGATVRAKPNLKLLGPKLGPELPELRRALAEGRFEPLPGGGVRVDGRELEAEEVFVERAAPEGWALAEGDTLSVALDVRLDPELEAEGRVYDLVHAVNTMRKEQGLELTDRIVLTLPDADDLERFQDWIRSETLAVEIEAGEELALRKA
jgi:isoleucyl-tRNA synthetase